MVRYDNKNTAQRLQKASRGGKKLQNATKGYKIMQKGCKNIKRQQNAAKAYKKATRCFLMFLCNRKGTKNSLGTFLNFSANKIIRL